MDESKPYKPGKTIKESHPCKHGCREGPSFAWDLLCQIWIYATKKVVRLWKFSSNTLLLGKLQLQTAEGGLSPGAMLKKSFIQPKAAEAIEVYL